jgi:hypothetical protein
MARVTSIIVLVLASVLPAWSAPTVDGVVSDGEYSRSLSLDYDAVTVHYDVGADGGLTFAVSAATTGWVGIGLGSVVMDGAHIFIGYVRDGKAVFSEQLGSGHTHAPSGPALADSEAVRQDAGTTTIEFHVPAGKVPVDGGKLDIIVAFSGSADLTTYHEDNHDGAIIDLSSPR